MDMRSQWCRFQAAFVLPALMLFCWATLPASAQVQIPPSAFAEETEIETFIDKGKDLEQQGRWGEAYQYYLRDGRQFQDNVKVKNRKAMARIHYDLNRRYADSSFVQAVTNGNHQVSLNVLHEVLLKIDTYHVDQPNWYVMVRHGMSSVEVALLQHEAFQNHFLNNVSPAAIQNAIGRMHEKAKSSPLNNRQQAYQVASAIAAQMEADLNIPSAAIIYEFVCGAIVALDPYSGFLTANQYGETMSQIEGNFVGLGVELKTTDQHLEIVAVIPNGPASQQSIRKGDKIVSVANKPVTEIGGEKAADMLRGEQGSQILIGLEDPEGQMRNVTITRQHVEIPSVQSVAIIDTENATGYLKLTSFQKTTTKDLDLALWQLHRQGMKRLIVDVRGNPGGLLDSSVEVSNRFIQKGRIVLTRGRNPVENSDRAAEFNGTWHVPLVVLVDENSASASEIFAGAIQDHKRGTIVGTRSYGKGSVQGIFALNSAKGGVRLTTAKFFTPTGRKISHDGVTPSIQVHSAAKPANGLLNMDMQQEDRALQMAIEVAAKQ